MLIVVDGAIASPDASNVDKGDDLPRATHENSSDGKESTGDTEHAEPAAANLFGDADDISDAEGAEESSDNEKEASQVRSTLAVLHEVPQFLRFFMTSSATVAVCIQFRVRPLKSPSSRKKRKRYRRPRST